MSLFSYLLATSWLAIYLFSNQLLRLFVGQDVWHTVELA